MVNFIMALVAWFNGKKTVIGAACIWIATILIPGLLINTWHLDFAWLGTITDTLMWIGGILTPLGLAHKAFKG